MGICTPEQVLLDRYPPNPPPKTTLDKLHGHAVSLLDRLDWHVEDLG